MWTIGFHTPWGTDAFHCTALGLSAWVIGVDRPGPRLDRVQGSEINRDQPSKRREMAEVNAALCVYMSAGLCVHTRYGIPTTSRHAGRYVRHADEPPS